MSKTPIIGFDHPVIAVRDMNESRARYERLGFYVPPRGSHKEWGTGNWCIMFAHDYLELRGIVDPARYTHGLDEFLAKREGLMGVAFTGDRDNREATKIFEERGLNPRPVRELTRRFELPDGEVEPSFRLLFFREGETGPLMASLICQHLTPALLRQPAFLHHPNQVDGIVSLISVSDDLDGAEDLLGKYLEPEAVHRHERSLEVDVGRAAKFVVLTQAEAKRQGLTLEADMPYLTAICLSTKSIDACEAALKRGGIPFARTAAKRLRVEAAEACGVTLDFIEG